MMLLPDTNVWIKFLNPGLNRVKEQLLAVDPADLRMSSVVKAELYYGAMKGSRTSENLALLEALFQSITSLPFDDLAAEKYGEIRSNLARQGMPIGPNDLMIAATAAAYGAVVVTHNTREFSRVDGLQIVDWELER